ncbi:MAG: glycosyltransferase [Candidatus Eisenbacteria bacterium]|uniref:Glycosyltransferase n=1 Tax=Eiseniibacteriota bacterium TaxID=2212470 RepID=A0A948WEQ4_UNCEI|nr:glycosyltransferase [Candidatus Eisenbacteria bacterium]MBU1950401.1 glycosyltransferase [Candidatus Eisenbacteria bacterium]MBU2692978.1 glycosyltransferase [Candidatus Eisenbacteria bacterium]
MKSSRENSNQDIPPEGIAKNPRLSILFIHYRTTTLLQKGLDALKKYPPEVSAEIIVIDNGPAEDGAAEICSSHPLCRYHNPKKNLGYAKAVNLGIGLSRAEYVLILNPDVFVMKGAVDSLVAVMDGDPRIGIAGPKLLNPDGTLQYSCRSFYTIPTLLLRRTFLGKVFPHHRVLRDHLMSDWDHATSRDVDWMIGGSLMIRRKMMDDVGGMDERFFLYFEDVDWCYRAHQRGWRVLYVPDATMYHHHRRESAKGFLGFGMRRHLESWLRYTEKWSMILYILKLKTTQIRTFVTVISDIAMLTAAFLAAYSLRALFGALFANPLFPLSDYLRFLFFANTVGLLAFIGFGLYRARAWFDPFHGWWQLVRAMVVISMVMMASTYLMHTRTYSRVIVALYFPLTLLFVGLGRGCLRRLVRKVKRQGLQLKRFLVVGSMSQIETFQRSCEAQGRTGIEPICFQPETLERHPSGEILNPAEEMIRWVQRERIGEVLVFETEKTRAILEEVIEPLSKLGVPVGLVPVSQGLLVPGSRIEGFFGWSVLSIGGRRGRGVSSPLKRTMDLLVALPILILGFPLHLINLSLLRGKPKLETRKSIGRKGRIFDLRRYVKETGLTRILRWMALYPRLPNVIGGRMSIVGIYPFPVEIWDGLVESERKDAPDAPPGLMGLWGSDPWIYNAHVDYRRLNRYYVLRWSFEEDLRIFWGQRTAGHEMSRTDGAGAL